MSETKLRVFKLSLIGVSVSVSVCVCVCVRLRACMYVRACVC